MPLIGGSEHVMDTFRDAKKASISLLNIIQVVLAWLVIRRLGMLVLSRMRHPFSIAIYITPRDIRVVLYDTRNSTFFPLEVTITLP